MQLTDIPGIGDKTARALEKSGIKSLQQLLETYPRTYRAYSASTAKEARVGDWVILKGHLTRPISRRTAKVTTQLSSFQDHTGHLTLRWFNLPYLTRSIRPNAIYLVKGQVTEFNSVKQIISPQLTVADENTPLRDELVPIYRQLGSLKPWVIRTKISNALNTNLPPDPLPTSVLAKYDLIPYQEALENIHHPPDTLTLEKAIYRLSFQELFELQLKELKKNTRRSSFSPLKINQNLLTKFIASLPFTLTPSQQAAIADITNNLTSKHRMQRLLAGEVGSGKTVVATAAALATHSAGKKTLIMAPTVILAEQLHRAINNFLKDFGLTTGLLTSSHKDSSSCNIITGTQALLNQPLKDIGLAIIDEQHRFGVKQREKLANLEDKTHTLLMTATPIPRSLALTLLGHLDITRLTDLPPNRLPVKTFVVNENKRRDAYDWISKQISTGNQVFMVTPLIEEAEEADLNPLKSLRSLEQELKTIFPHLTIDVMHGKMKDQEKTEHMQAFQQGTTQILVATSMIEVGIDVPAANIIVIEDAERFGLAQLHQLRGRVGRGGEQGYCLLFTNSQTLKSKNRLAFFVRENQGDKLALYDLQDRGPGEIFGNLQHGFFSLKLASIYDEKLLLSTYQAAKETLST